MTNTFLDILLSLLQFNRDNQNFFFFVLRNLHSGFNKINWTRTIGTTNAIVQEGSPIYLNPVNKKRQINFDEELLVIFFSILNYIGDHYGFPKNINLGFQLIKGRQFETYMNGMGKVRLQQIKYKYFSDKALELWNLCYAFFDNARRIYVSSDQREYLLVKNFNIVFEAMIDELIGEKNVPAGLKEQDDGKRIDHMYAYKGLTTYEEDKPIYYIGDSKYYKQGNPIGKESIYKQFTYARNVIQWNLNLFMNDDQNDEELQADKRNFSNVPKLRDDVTEGYNIIPNFFISARLNKDFDYSVSNIEKTERPCNVFSNRQFENRLFDRDTLLICHYDVNFLYVVSLYARNNSLQKAAWKKEVRDKFRSEIQTMLKEKFDFYAMKAHPNVEARSYIKEHFQDVLGKIYTPFGDKKYFSLALDKDDPEKNNEVLLKELRKHFFVEKCDIGEDPTPKLTEAEADEGGKYTAVPGQKCLIFNLLGDQYTNSEAKLVADNRFGIAIQSEEGHNVLHLQEGMASVAYLVITNKRECRVYSLEASPIFLTEHDCAGILSTKKDALVYLVFRVIVPPEDARQTWAKMIDMEKVRALFGSEHGIKMIDFNAILKDE